MGGHDKLAVRLLFRSEREKDVICDDHLFRDATAVAKSSLCYSCSPFLIYSISRSLIASKLNDLS